MPPAPLSTPLRSLEATSAGLEVPRGPGTWPISQIARRCGGGGAPSPPHPSPRGGSGSPASRGSSPATGSGRKVRGPRGRGRKQVKPRVLSVLFTFLASFSRCAITWAPVHACGGAWSSSYGTVNASPPSRSLNSALYQICPDPMSYPYPYELLDPSFLTGRGAVGGLASAPAKLWVRGRPRAAHRAPGAACTAQHAP